MTRPDAMFHLYTAHGTVVFVEPASGLLRHGPIGPAPANLVAERGEHAVTLIHVDGAGTRHPVALGAQRCGTGRPGLAPRHLAERGRTGLRSSLAADGRFLSAETDGTISFTRTMALDHEVFLLLTPAQRDDLHTLVVGNWVTASARRLLLAAEKICLPQFTVRLRQSDHELEPLLDQLRPPGAAPLAARGRLELRTEGWRLDWLHLFRPLAYLTVFGAEEEFACAVVTIGSLLQFGRWPGDILVITDAAHADFASRLPADLAPRIHVAAVQADDTMDRALARYRIADIAVAAGYQPILYLDTGVVCDAPLDALLVGLAMSDRLHTAPDRLLLDPDDAHGRTLFLRDGYSDQGNAIGFATALMGFRTVRDVREAFAAILACAYGFAEEEQTRDFFPHPDQAFANYVMQKIGVFDLSLIYACLSTGATPEGAGGRKGLMRFVVPGGDPAVKLAGMRRHVELALAAR